MSTNLPAESFQKPDLNLFKQPISTVCAADNAYAMPLAVVLKSILVHLNARQKANFYIIDGGITKRNKQRILKGLDLERCQVHWLNPLKSKLSSLRINSCMSVAAYHRLLVAELLPESLDKIIYLDSDLVVLNDLEKLWEIDVGNNYILAAQDIGIGYVSSELGLENYQALGLEADCKYFNSGVMVINLNKWRTDSVGPKVIEYIQQNPQFIRWYDQDGLNALLAKNWGELPPQWNRTPQIYHYPSWHESPFEESAYNSLIKQPSIIHFATTGRKPWNDSHYPDGDIFYKYLDMTDWAGWRYNLWRALQHKVLLTSNRFQRTFLKKGLS